MSKHIKILAILLCLTLPLMILGIHRNVQTTRVMSRGNYFFEKIRNAPHISRITISFADSKQINLQKKEDLWRVKEADDYYASFNKIKALFNLLYNTTIYRTDTINKNDITTYSKDAISLQFFDDKNNIIDDVIISSKQPNAKFHYALRPNENYLYQLRDSFVFSSLVIDWIESPLLSIPHRQIKRIKTDNFEVFRRFATDELHPVGSSREIPQILNLINSFWYLTPIDVMHAVHFNNQDYKNVKRYEISTLDGLIYLINIFSKDDEYWVSIKLSSDDIISSQAYNFYQENSILYDSWFFRIEKEIAENISSFVL